MRRFSNAATLPLASGVQYQISSRVQHRSPHSTTCDAYLPACPPCYRGSSRGYQKQGQAGGPAVSAEWGLQVQALLLIKVAEMGLLFSATAKCLQYWVLMRIHPPGSFFTEFY